LLNVRRDRESGPALRIEDQAGKPTVLLIQWCPGASSRACLAADGPSNVVERAGDSLGGTFFHGFKEGRDEPLSCRRFDDTSRTLAA